jgi:hypothetical protein
MTALREVVREIEEHVAGDGWDQPPRLFALVPTAQLLAHEPSLVPVLGPDGAGAAGAPDTVTPVEQDELPEAATLEELLAAISWPEPVAGVALAVERAMLPPSVEDGLPADPAAALAVLADHPDREDVRLVVAVLRDGTRDCALRTRSHDEPDAVLTGPDLVPGLAQALAATLEP